MNFTFRVSVNGGATVATGLTSEEADKLALELNKDWRNNDYIVTIEDSE